MKFSEIKDKLTPLTLSQKSLFIKLFLVEISMINRILGNEKNSSDLEKINAYRWSNELVYELQKIQFELDKFEDNNSIDSIIEGISFTTNQSKLLSQHIPSALSKTYTRFNETGRSWDFEQDIDSQRRYLIIWDKIPYPENTQLKLQSGATIDLKERPNIFSLGVAYAYGNIELPKTYEIVFDTKDLSRFWECKTVVLAAENSRRIHWDLWIGHHSRCFIEIIGNIPEIFNELPTWGVNSKTHRGIGLCSKFDWYNIKKTQEIVSD